MVIVSGRVLEKAWDGEVGRCRYLPAMSTAGERQYMVTPPCVMARRRQDRGEKRGYAGVHGDIYMSGVPERYAHKSRRRATKRKR